MNSKQQSSSLFHAILRLAQSNSMEVPKRNDVVAVDGMGMGGGVEVGGGHGVDPEKSTEKVVEIISQ